MAALLDTAAGEPAGALGRGFVTSLSQPRMGGVEVRDGACVAAIDGGSRAALSHRDAREQLDMGGSSNAPRRRRRSSLQALPDRLTSVSDPQLLLQGLELT